MNTIMEMEWELACIVCKNTFLMTTGFFSEEGHIMCPSCKAWSGHTFTKVLICPTKSNPKNDLVDFCQATKDGKKCGSALFLNAEVRHIRKRYCKPCVGRMMREQYIKAKAMYIESQRQENSLTD